MSDIAAATDQLVALYDRPFGGKLRGRFRISMKLMRNLLGRRRLWPEDIEEIRRALYERGYLLIDLETFFVVISQQTFASYRRVNDMAVTRQTAAEVPAAQSATLPAEAD